LQARGQIGAESIKSQMSKGGLTPSGEFLQLPTELFGPRALVIITRFPFHASFSAFLASYLDPLHGRRSQLKIIEPIPELLCRHLFTVLNSYSFVSAHHPRVAYEPEALTKLLTKSSKRSGGKTADANNKTPESATVSSSESASPPKELCKLLAAGEPCMFLDDAAHMRRYTHMLPLESQSLETQDEVKANLDAHENPLAFLSSAHSLGSASPPASSSIPLNLSDSTPLSKNPNIHPVSTKAKEFIFPSISLRSLSKKAPKAPLFDVDFRLLSKLLPPCAIVALFEALLFEQKILCVSRHMEILTPCLEALLALLHPLEWQFAYIPVSLVRSFHTKSRATHLDFFFHFCHYLHVGSTLKGVAYFTG
jgi:hypothetical protein